ncbi:MAG: hypothetical protein PHW79_09890, partial [Candidatus Marinimicrobia bacterium]|nr:hypothetical protein [Candidatus Neomarinimicrobiota bacterium]
ILYVVQVPTPGIEKDAQEVQQGKKTERELEERGSWFENYRDYYTWCSLYNQASITDYYEAKASFSSQVTNSNLFKVGAEAWLMDQDYNASSSETVSSFIWRTGFGTNYKAKTKYAAAYIQDKIEFAGMVANLGVRADAYNFGGKVPVDRYNLFYQAEYEGFPDGIGIPKWYDSKTYVTLSPRIGFSFPISDKTAFRVQYGHFRSMPIIRQALDNQTNHGWGIYGNPNLEPKLSINYEVGLQQNLWGTHQLDVVTYYNDLKNQVSSIYVETSAGSTRTYYDWAKGTYITYDNSGYGTSQGVEITFSNRDVNRLRYRFSYTLSQTTSGNHGVYLYREEMTEDMIQRYSFDATDVLSSEDRTHRFNGSVSYTFPEKSGVKVIGFFPFENVTFGLVYRATSGLGYSWSPDYETDFVVESNRRYPIESSTDLQLEKRIKVEGMNFILNVRILNLFNNKQLTPFTSYDELTRWVKRSVTYEDADDAPNRDYRLYNYFQVYKNIPREVYFTVGLDF